MKTIRFKLDVVAYIDTDDVKLELIQPEPDEAAIVEAIVDLTGGELFEPEHFMESGLLMGWKVAVEVDFVAAAEVLGRQATQELESVPGMVESILVASTQSIENVEQHEAALKRVMELWGVDLDTPEGEELDRLATAIDAFESKHYKFDSAFDSAFDSVASDSGNDNE